MPIASAPRALPCSLAMYVENSAKPASAPAKARAEAESMPSHSSATRLASFGIAARASAGEFARTTTAPACSAALRTRSHITGARSSIASPANDDRLRALDRGERATLRAGRRLTLAPGAPIEIRHADRAEQVLQHVRFFVGQPAAADRAGACGAAAASHRAIAFAHSANASSQPICTNPPPLRSSGCVSRSGEA